MDGREDRVGSMSKPYFRGTATTLREFDKKDPPKDEEKPKNPIGFDPKRAK